MAEPNIIVRREASEAGFLKGDLAPWSEGFRYRVLGWFGLVLAAAAIGDYALALYPLGFGSPEWEMGTVAALAQGLPLSFVGLTLVWVSAAGLRLRWLMWVIGAVMVLAAVTILAGLALFIADAPIALRATAENAAARLTVQKMIARTLFLGLLFGSAYGVAGVFALRQARAGSTTEA